MTLCGSSEHTDTCSDLMGATADKTKHTGGIDLIDRFTKNLFSYDDYGIGRDDEFVWGEAGTIGIGLFT